MKPPIHTAHLRYKLYRQLNRSNRFKVLRHYITPGVRYMLLSTFFFSLMNLGVKMLPNVPVMQIVLFRSAVIFTISYLTLRAQHVHPWGQQKQLLVLRGLTGSIGLVMYFISLQKMPLAGAVTIQYLSPIFAALLGVYIVAERIRAVQWLFFALSFGGVALIQGFDARIAPQYLLLGLAAAFTSGLSYNIIRKLKTSEHPLVIMLYFPLLTLPIASIWCMLYWQPITLFEACIMLVVGVCTQLAQYYMTMAYQLERLSRVTPLNYVGIVYALLMGWLILGETFDLWAIIGMALVAAGVILNLHFTAKD